MKFTLLLSTLLFLGLGCTPAPKVISDFVPTQGKATAPNDEDASTQGPFERRLQTAISYDGLSYVSNSGWISDQANVPDAVVTQDGTLYLYYSGWVVGDRLNSSAVAISQDNGVSWTYHYIEMNGAESLHLPADPDVVLLNDGTFRMYFTSSQTGGNISIYYGESMDGINFEYKGVIISLPDRQALDSTTFKIGDTWHMYALSDKGVDELWHLTSTDGVIFEVYGLTSFPYDGKSYVPSNGVWIENKFHLMLFHPREASIVSMWTKNGLDWYPDEGTRLDPTEEETYVHDSTIVPLKNGQSLMIYTTNTP
ncbi:hypothetical protein HQ487_04875 [Candidatus Uhrbacteria bacterium]|nr:hypothetical protein [Candidatus Uhrbacteria bacterium]